MKLRLKRVLLYITTLLTASFVFFYFLVSTNIGLHWLLRLASHFMQGLTIGQVSGNIRQHFILHEVNYATPSMQLSAKQIEVVWHPLNWFSKAALIQSLNIEGLDVNIVPSKNKSSSGQLGWLKKNYFSSLTIRGFKVSYNNSIKIYINEINVKHNTNRSYHLIILFPKGKIIGDSVLKSTSPLIFLFNANGNNIDTHAIWPASHSDLNFSIFAKGEWNNDNKKLTFAVPSLSGKLNSYSLTGKVSLAFDNGNTNIQQLSLQVADSTVYAKGAAGKQWDINWKINIKDFSKFYPNFRGALISQGNILTSEHKQIITGSIKAKNLKFGKIAINKLSGTLASSLKLESPANLQLLADRVYAHDYVFPTLKANLFMRRVRNTLQIVGGLDFLQNNKAQINFGLTDFFNNYNSSITGKINFNFNNLTHLLASKHLKNIAGHLAGYIKITGKLTSPRLSGNMYVNGGKFYVPRLAATVYAVNAQSKLNNSGIATLVGSFKSGKGAANVHGQVNLFETNFPFKLFIKGSNLQAANLPEYKIVVTPDLQISFDGMMPTISGSLILPYVRIVTQNYSKAITLPNEVIFTGQTSPINYFSNLNLHIKLTLGDDIYVAYKNLQASLTGSLNIFQVAGGLPTADGELVIKKGVYKVYDKLFSINGGRLIYVGNLLNNPGLSIQAYRVLDTNQVFGFTISKSKLNSLSVGVLVQGTLDDPVVSLVSQPMLSQDDILSYLVFGQPRSELTGSSALALLGALSSSMNLQGPAMGDQSNIGSGILGIFKMGLLGSSHVFNISFSLTDHWEIRTEAGVAETGIDLLYVYEGNSIF